MILFSCSFTCFLGPIWLGEIWSRRSLSQIKLVREMDSHAFLGEKTTVLLKITNKGILPIPWLRIHEGLPLELSSGDGLQHVISLGPRGNETIEYRIDPKKRGYYKVGPLYLRTGDLLGVSRELDAEGSVSYLTVYPRIIPLDVLSLPSRSPSGTMKYHQPMYEDASRIFGKRDYSPGDSIRRIDWKATAGSGKLQVKQFEPSIDLNTMIFLDMYANNFSIKTRYTSGEMAVTVAASIAAWVTSKGQSIGLVSNGVDELNPLGSSYLPSARGNYQLMSLLEILARLQLQETTSMLEMLETNIGRLQWGTTLVLVTGDIREADWQQIIQAQKAGLQVSVYIIGASKSYPEIKAKAGLLNIGLSRLANELDLQTWQDVSIRGKLSYN